MERIGKRVRIPRGRATVNESGRFQKNVRSLSQETCPECSAALSTLAQGVLAATGFLSSPLMPEFPCWIQEVSGFCFLHAAINAAIN
jgi:hypothetical protein